MVNRLLFNGISGMRDAVRRMSVTSHNVANLQTSGFKTSQVRSADVVSGGVGAGVTTLSVVHTPESGPFMETGRWSDIAVNGSGYIAVQDVSGKTFYTRNGSFHQNTEGALVNEQGYRLLNAQGSPIPPLDSAYSTFRIDEGGQIWGVRSDGTSVNLGPDYRIGIATFPNDSGLIAQGGTLYLPSATSGDPSLGAALQEGRGAIVSGFLEGSNVSVEAEMVNMVLAKAAYTANARVVETGNEMMETLFHRTA